MLAERDAREHEREDQLDELRGHEHPAPVERVGENAAHRREEQQRTELRECEQPDVARRLREDEPVRAEEHVLHPRADVRREHTDPEHAEVAVSQRGAGGAADQDDVAVDQSVGDPLRVGVIGTVHLHRVQT